jgi:hypothetical protein
LASIFFGAFGLISLYYWTSVIFCYVGLSLLFIDAYFHPELTKGWRATLVCVVVVLFAGFTFGIVLVPAPINFWATCFGGEYPSGAMVAGIPWSKKYVELRIYINNPTRFDYEEVNLVIRPDKPVVAVAQAGEYPKVTFRDAYGSNTHLEDLTLATGERKVIPLMLIATDSGYRVRCEKLPAHTNIQMVMAIASVYEPAKGSIVNREDPRFFLKEGYEGGTSYWYGHEIWDGLYAERPSVTNVHIDGEYRAVLKNRSLTATDIAVRDTIKDILWRE